MKFIAICAFDCIPINLVLKEVAKSILKGYDAGGVLLKDYQNLPCHWTSYEDCAGKNDIIIQSDVELSRCNMAAMVLNYKKN